MKSKRIALIQVRESEEARLHEQECFADACNVAPDQLIFLDLVHGPQLEWDHVEDLDALLIGGAGAYSAVENYPFTGALTQVVLRWISAKRPVFGSCWGHHFLARALGGELVHDRSMSEVGTFPITLTSSGQVDLLFQKMPQSFMAQLGHHDRIVRLPPGAVELGYSERCRYQAFKLEDRPVYGTQFHSELDSEALLLRLNMYRDTYLDENLVLEDIAQAVKPSPYVRSLLRSFLELFA